MVIPKELGQLPEDPEKALQVVADYIAYLAEQINFNDQGIKKRLMALENNE